MNSFPPFLLLSSILFLLLRTGVGQTKEDDRKVYIVYMGSVPTNDNQLPSIDSLEEEHFQLLASVVRSKEHQNKAILRRYKHGFSGFAARLSQEEALAIRENPKVVSVFADPIFQLHTTRSWEFLELQTAIVVKSNPIFSGKNENSSSGNADTIIGVLDTGVWPESRSFDDNGMDAIPSRWKGKCETSGDFNSSSCNRKLIGARSYSDSSGPTRPAAQSPRDILGHGTHTASTAGGSPVEGASYYGLASGTAKGGSTTSRIAMYKICGSEGCSGSAILAAYDDAIADGVDVLSLSLGAASYQHLDFQTDPIALGAFHAVAKGVTVICSAGNDGPDAGTVVNAAPWILTVAASTIDREFESDVVLGCNNKHIKGKAINFSDLDKSAIYPLIYGGAASASNNTKSLAKSCDPGSLDQDKVKGKIVYCTHLSAYGLTMSEKADGLKSLGARGMVLSVPGDNSKTITRAFVSLPVTVVSSQGGDEILSYMNSTKDPVATVLPTVTVENYKPAPAVAEFSARGPCWQTRNILKPDITAPGTNILAAWPTLDNSRVVPPGKQPTPFNLVSGTSMSCPHVSGVAAFIKSKHPDWSPSAIRSAIMTTASQKNNNKAPLTGTAYDWGAGEVNPLAALQPGFVYELQVKDYLQFLCNYGLNTSTIRLISEVPDGFQCPENSSRELISDLNYPSIAVSVIDVKRRTVTRTVTNVEDEVDTYVASIDKPDGLEVNVMPEKLSFTKANNKLSYQVSFSLSKEGLPKYLFGSITWSNGKQNVRSNYVVGTQK